MPVSVERDERFYHLRCVGEYGADEVICAFEELLRSDDLPEGAALLIDLRQADSVLRRSVADLRRVALAFIEHGDPFGRRCALLTEGRARYGLMRMASMWVEFQGVDARVFLVEEEARSWLLG